MTIATISKYTYQRRLEDILDKWKSYGAVSTPQEIVSLMIKLADLQYYKNLDILEPACGFCNFLIGIYQRYPKNNFYGLEINDKIYKDTKVLFKNFPFHIVKADYLTWKNPKKFDLVIGNPPYGIIGNDSHYPINIFREKKEEYKKIFRTWRGKYNIYGAFIEKSINVLKDDGKLVFITPATWMILDEFSKLRQFLSYTGKMKIYYLGHNMFKGISVSVCILVFEKGKKGLELYYKNDKRFIKSISKNSWVGDIIKFETEYTKNLEKNKILLEYVFDIKISARSPEVRNYTGLLLKPKNGALPFMNGRNIKKGIIDRRNYTNLWLEKKESGNLKAFYKILPRIVVGHTKGGKIFAAIEDKPYPYIGDVYHLLPKIKLTKNELRDIVDWLNSKELEKYITTLYKEITPHTTATQLKRIPLNIKININRDTLFDI